MWVKEEVVRPSSRSNSHRRGDRATSLKHVAGTAVLLKSWICDGKETWRRKRPYGIGRSRLDNATL